ncbi:MAG: hypothetical protein OEY86_07530 [Nitrospira sp.]|nr:hypothetical protein [Nitrospira sp.]
MNTLKHENFQQYIQLLYRDAITEPLSRYVPGRAARVHATRRGNARKIHNQRAGQLFDRMMKKGAL